MVRDLSAELGKEVILETEGGDTELDKKVLEMLKDPLIHLLRNAVSHGIEMAETRAAAGKDVDATANAIVHAMDEFAAGEHRTDDVTLVLARRD